MLVVCPCGQKLKAPDATPGRAGKCPRCGSTVKISPTPATTAALDDDAVGPPLVPRSPTPDHARAPARPGDGQTRPWPSIGSLLIYPLQDSTGIGFLLKIPICFGVAVLILPFAIASLVISKALIVFGLLLGLIPLFILGHTLSYLGAILETSCRGKSGLPAPASWDSSEVFDSLGRWLWAFLAGFIVRIAISLLYLGVRGIHISEIGRISAIDRTILLGLDYIGVGYTQMILVLALTRDSPWAAGNPLLVARAIRRAGWGYLAPCAVSALFNAGFLGSLHSLINAQRPLTSVLTWYGWSIGSLYLTMVAMRFLGLYCHRTRAHKV